MRTAAAIVVFVGLVANPLMAQEPRGWYGDRVQGIPPGQLPPPGQCRVWYDNRPAGRQPRATNCVEAERAAARDSHARVIYGDNRDGRRAVPRGYPSRSPYPAQYPNGRAGYGYGTVPFDNGYKDGYDKGREDARDNDSYDPVRHGRYRSGDHGYDRRYGTKEQYKLVYRQGFDDGYYIGYRDARGPNRQTAGNSRPWLF
jgi:hypothetical protein